jgi:hypothetical protein
MYAAYHYPPNQQELLFKSQKATILKVQKVKSKDV